MGQLSRAGDGMTIPIQARQLSIERSDEIASLLIQMADTNIESHLIEKRVFKPSKAFAKAARIKSLEQYRRMYRESIRHPAKFWAREAGELVWQKGWESVLKLKAPFAQWFVGGEVEFFQKRPDSDLSGPKKEKEAEPW